MSSKLGEIIKLAREAKSIEGGKAWSQDKLAEEVRVTKQYISGIETGKRSPGLSLLIDLYDKLVGIESEGPENPMSLWLLAYLEGLIAAETLPDDRKEFTRAVIAKAVADLNQPRTTQRSGLGRTLEHFPYLPEKLTIVCGDRRELRPENRGDIFAHSVSIIDLTFLSKLRLPRNVSIRSDKPFVVMERKYLEAEFGNTNLLIIGSPAVNFAARLVNNYSVFRFNLPQKLKQEEELMRTLKEPSDWEPQLLPLRALKDKKKLDVFWQLAQRQEDLELAISENDADQPARKELAHRLYRGSNTSASDEIDDMSQLGRLVQQFLKGDNAKSLLNAFRAPGLIDFADGTVHGTSTRTNNDFGLISLARNPFDTSGDYVCVMVAGIHGPGTAHALKALAEDDFRDHPLGGIIEVEIDELKNWPDRIQAATWQWQTRPYTTDKLLTNLRNALQQRSYKFENLTDAEVSGCIAFIEHIANLRNSKDNKMQATA